MRYIDFSSEEWENINANDGNCTISYITVVKGTTISFSDYDHEYVILSHYASKNGSGYCWQIGLAYTSYTIKARKSESNGIFGPWATILQH